MGLELGKADVLQFHWNDWKLWFYYGMLFAGGVGLTVLLLTMILSPKLLRRNPVLISLCFTWWLGPFPCLSLLLFTNTLYATQPSPAICLASATMVMALTPMCSVSGLAIVYHIWSTLVFASDAKPMWRKVVILVILPYITFILFASATVTIGLLHPHTVNRASFYCVVAVDPLVVTVGGFSAVACVMAIAMEIWIAVVMKRHADRIARRGTDVQLIFRVFAFGLYLFIGLGLSIVTLFDFTSIIPDMCFSTYGLAVFLIFGSQKDVLRTWKNWFRSRKSSSSPHSSSDKEPPPSPSPLYPAGFLLGGHIQVGTRDLDDPISQASDKQLLPTVYRSTTKGRSYPSPLRGDYRSTFGLAVIEGDEGSINSTSPLARSFRFPSSPTGGRPGTGESIPLAITSPTRYSMTRDDDFYLSPPLAIVDPPPRISVSRDGTGPKQPPPAQLAIGGANKFHEHANLERYEEGKMDQYEHLHQPSLQPDYMGHTGQRVSQESSRSGSSDHRSDRYGGSQGQFDDSRLDSVGTVHFVGVAI